MYTHDKLRVGCTSVTHETRERYPLALTLIAAKVSSATAIERSGRRTDLWLLRSVPSDLTTNRALAVYPNHRRTEQAGTICSTFPAVAGICTNKRAQVLVIVPPQIF